MVVFLYGPHGVGKTTAGDNLQNHYQWRHLDFDILLYQNGHDILSELLNPVLFESNTVLSFGYREDCVPFITRVANETNAVRIWLHAPRRILDASLCRRGISAAELMNMQHLSIEKMKRELKPNVTMQVTDKNGCRLDVAGRIHKNYFTQ